MTDCNGWLRRDGGYFLKQTPSKQSPVCSNTVRLGERGVFKTFVVGHVVLLAFVSPPPHHDSVVVHVNGDSKDNRLGNLRWGRMPDVLKPRVERIRAAQVRRRRREQSNGETGKVETGRKA